MIYFFRSILIFLVVTFFSSTNLCAQTDYKSQDEMQKRAEEFFKKKDFVSAMPLYSQLLSLYPKDAQYNYKFGVCLMFADRRDTEKPIKYLDFAAKTGKADIPVYYYLGMAYHINYRFNEAIREYKKYKEKAGSKPDKTFLADRQIEMCSNGKALLSAATDLFVMEKVDASKKDFTRVYDLRKFGGKLLLKPEELKTKLDKKKNDNSLIFLPDSAQEVYFSSYGNDGLNGRDIYKSYKDKDGKWVKPINLGTTINTIYDEDFPFLLPNGKTLYFTSKGHNSMGGYDVFKSSQLKKGSWGRPENLDYPINTPFDDILFVPDSLQQYAYFSSNRVSIEGQINVYRVRIDKRPKIDSKTELEISSLYESDREDSSYLKTIEKIKNVSTLNVNANDNMFKDSVKNNNQMVANNNSNKNLNKNNITNKSNNKYTIPKDLTKKDIIRIAQSHVDSTKKDLNTLIVKKNVATNLANKKNELAKQKSIESKKAYDNANRMTDLKKSQDEINKAKQLKADAEKLENEAKIASDYSNKLGTQIMDKKNILNKTTQYADNITKTVESNPKDSSLVVLNKMINELKKSDEDTTTNADFALNKAKQEQITKQNLAKQYLAESKKLQEEAHQLSIDAEKLKNEAQQSKDPQIKQEFLQRADDAEKESKQKQIDANSALNKSNTLNFEVEYLAQQNDLSDNVMKDINTSNDLALNNNTNNSNNTNLNNNPNNNSNNNTTNNTNITNNNNANANLNVEKQKVLNNTKEQLALIKQNVADVDNRINNLLIVSDNNSKLALAKKIELDKQAEKVNIATDPEQKQSEIEKYEHLKSVYEEYAKQAVVAYNLYKELISENRNKQKEVNEMAAISDKIKDLTARDSVDQAKILLEKLSELVANASDFNSLSKDATENIRSASNQKQNLADKSESLSKQYMAKYDSLTIVAKAIKQKADDTKNKNKKQELLNQYEAITKQADANKQLALENKTEAKKLQIEASSFKMQLSYTTNVINETSNNKNNASVNTNSLEKDIIALKNNDAFPGYLATDTVSSENKQLIADNTNKTTNHSNYINSNNTNNTDINSLNNNNIIDTNNVVRNNNTTIIDTNHVVPVNNNQIASIPESQKETVKAQSYKNTADQINEEIVVIEKRLPTITDAYQKQTAQKDIVDLKKKVVELNKKSDDALANAEKLKKNEHTNNIIIANLTNQSLNENLVKEVETLQSQSDSLRKVALQTQNAKDKKEALDEAQKLDIIKRNKQTQSSEITSLINQDTYYSNRLAIEKIKTSDVKNDQLTVADLLQDDARYYFEKAQKIKDSIKTNTSIETKANMLSDAIELENKALNKQNEAFAIYKKVNEDEVLANNNNLNNSTNNSNSTNNPNNTSNNNPNNTSNNNTNNTNSRNNTNNNTNINSNNNTNNNTLNNNNNNNNTTNNTNNNNTNVIEDSNRVKTNIIHYNTITNVDNKVIPLDTKLPDNLIFKVQIGAFYRPVPSTSFKGLSPLTGETTPRGLIRYFAGLFTLIDDAVTARDKIRQTGIKDAFVVAFLNGKRISIDDARIYLATGQLPTNFNVVANNNTNANNKVIEENSIAKISGLIYSVQVGVYVRPITSAQLFNITPLYGERMGNNLLRYISGTYKSREDATLAKNQIVTKGVKDAFVVVYYNGKKISFDEAKKLEANGVVANPNTNNGLNNNNVIAADTTSNTTIPVTDIIFKIQIGAYKENVPVEIVDQLLNSANGKVENFKNDEGLTVYTTGNFKTYDEANQSKNAMITGGLKDAFIIAFQGKNKIPVNKAIELLNNK